MTDKLLFEFYFFLSQIFFVRNVWKKILIWGHFCLLKFFLKVFLLLRDKLQMEIMSVFKMQRSKRVAKQKAQSPDPISE